MTLAAIAIRPKVLANARQMSRCLADAEDLAGDAYLAFFKKPPKPRPAGQLFYWFRTVMRNQKSQTWRDFHGAVVVSYEGIEEERARRAEL